MRVVAENYEQTHKHIHTHIHTYTHTRDNYSNPRCAHARRGLITDLNHLLQKWIPFLLFLSFYLPNTYIIGLKGELATYLSSAEGILQLTALIGGSSMHLAPCMGCCSQEDTCSTAVLCCSRASVFSTELHIRKQRGQFPKRLY